MSPVDSVMPRRTAAPLPRLRGCVRTLTCAVALGEPRELARRLVGGAVVDQEHLEPQVEREQLVDDLADRGGLVEDGHDDAHQRRPAPLVASGMARHASHLRRTTSQWWQLVAFDEVAIVLG